MQTQGIIYRNIIASFCLGKLALYLGLLYTFQQQRSLRTNSWRWFFLFLLLFNEYIVLIHYLNSKLFLCLYWSYQYNFVFVIFCNSNSVVQVRFKLHDVKSRLHKQDWSAKQSVTTHYTQLQKVQLTTHPKKKFGALCEIFNASVVDLPGSRKITISSCHWCHRVTAVNGYRRCRSRWHWTPDTAPVYAVAGSKALRR